MMRILLIIITTCLLCASCGVKDMPEYESQESYDKAAHIV